MNINALLSSSEGKRLEFKRDLSSLKPILKTLVAFANTAGGTLIIGRADDDFKAGVSHVRNIVVSRVLHELGLMEQWGSGYQRIITACRQGGYPEPEWQELASCVRVIFRPHPDVPVNVPVEGAAFNDRQQWFLEQLSLGRSVKATDIEAQWGVSEKTAKRDIAALRKRELIVFVGAPKTGRYQLKGCQ